MQLFPVAASLFFALACTVALVAPTSEVQTRDVYTPCHSGPLLNVPQCCGPGLLEVDSGGCEPPPTTPSSGADFKSICAMIRREPHCCIPPFGGLPLVCTDPVGL
ncbi:cerato-ulmin [Mycena capillaripes]|nr:cerato-ulmin [Mycena capillaripes]